MCYGTDFPANEVGGTKNLWGMGEYGLREVWVRREATVFRAAVRESNQMVTPLTPWSVIRRRVMLP